MLIREFGLNRDERPASMRATAAPRKLKPYTSMEGWNLVNSEVETGGRVWVRQGWLG